jgi:P-type Cu2+ transporter
VSTSLCLHCGLRFSSVPAGSRGEFCCSGCAAVYGLLHAEGLARYYALRDSRGIPVAEGRPGRRDAKWLESIAQRVCTSEPHARVVLDLQGLHCVGCVWLIEEIFNRANGGDRIEVNPALGRVDIVVRPDFDVRAFVASVERFGYLFGPPIKPALGGSSDLVWRLGVCSAIAMNSIIFAIPLYAGLDRGPVFALFTALNFGLGALAVAVGGTVFFRSAWHALRRRMLHLDLPIALGIALAFAGSAHSYFVQHSRAAYFDTIDVFIALMLLGRWLQERVVDRNRAWLLASDGTDGLLARRVRQARVEIVRCAEIANGDTLLVAPGDLVPVDGRLEKSAGTFSLDWIVGESRPRSYAPGEIVPAGAFAAGDEAALVRATTGFDESPLRQLLRAPERRDLDTARTTPWFQRLAKLYVLTVLVIAGGGFVAWWLATRDASRALAVTTSVLIVTCPCAFGIAVPLAYEMVQAGLRRAGLFVRRASFLDRALDVRRVVFDKTGTLTTGKLVLANPDSLDALTREQANVLYDLVARSGHPKSAAVREAFHARGATLDEASSVVEYPGRGLELARDGKRWRIGEPSWVGPRSTTTADLAFGVDGEILAELTTTECLRADASKEIAALTAAGCEVWLLSGDAQERVDAAAEASGISVERSVGEQTPDAKARFLDAHDRGDTLFVGDGVNDATALDRAHVSGTPAVDRPYVPARADFFFTTPGLAPIRLALRSARALAQVVRADLAIALGYNVIAISLALAGWMSPLLCAILMPASSLTTIAATVATLSPRSPLWRS